MDQALLVFITVAEKQNFTRAAEELHMTQPAVSNYIQSLEKQLGTKLLERTNKYVRLNKAGLIVYHHAKEIIGVYNRMHLLVDDLIHVAGGELSIGASYTFGEYILPHIVGYMRGKYPLIKPTIIIGNTREIEEKVANQQIDVGIVEGDFRHEHLYIEPFAEDFMYLIVSAKHPLANKDKICIQDVSEETWIVREIGSGTREATERMFASLNIQPQNIMEFGSTQIIKESVAAGLGITMLSHWVVKTEISIGTLRMIKLDGIPFTRKFSLVTKSTEFQTKASEVFLQILRNHEGIPRKNIASVKSI